MRRPVLRAIASRGGPLVSLFVRLLSRTWWLEIEGLEHFEEARVAGRGVLYCFWHGRMLELAEANAGRLPSEHGCAEQESFAGVASRA